MVMMSLREYRNKADRLADFLPWAALVAPGVVLNKDGSFQRSARFRGPDLDSATPSELGVAAARINNALRRLGSSWAIFVEAARSPAQDYPLELQTMLLASNPTKRASPMPSSATRLSKARCTRSIPNLAK